MGPRRRNDERPHQEGQSRWGNAFDLLRAVLADKEDKQAAALFAEFAKAFKGKRQLSWSNGLKAKFNLVEKNDEELAAELEDNAELLGLISPDEWRDVLKVRRGLPCLSWRLLLAGLRSKISGIHRRLPRWCL